MFVENAFHTTHKYGSHWVSVEDRSPHRKQARIHCFALVDEMNMSHARFYDFVRVLGNAVLKPSRLKDVDHSSRADLFTYSQHDGRDRRMTTRHDPASTLEHRPADGRDGVDYRTCVGQWESCLQKRRRNQCPWALATPAVPTRPPGSARSSTSMTNPTPPLAVAPSPPAANVQQVARLARRRYQRMVHRRLAAAVPFRSLAAGRAPRPAGCPGPPPSAAADASPPPFVARTRHPAGPHQAVPQYLRALAPEASIATSCGSVDCDAKPRPRSAASCPPAGRQPGMWRGQQ